MCPPLRDFARLMTASEPRSSMSCTFCSSSRMLATAAHHPTRRPLVQNRTRLPGCALLRRSELHEVFAGEACVAERPRLGAHRLVHSFLGEISERVRGHIF